VCDVKRIIREKLESEFLIARWCWCQIVEPFDKGAIIVEVIQVQCSVIEISPLDSIGWHVVALVALALHPC
jgi:hypothetical protein